MTTDNLEFINIGVRGSNGRRARAVGGWGVIAGGNGGQEGGRWGRGGRGCGYRAGSRISD